MAPHSSGPWEIDETETSISIKSGRNTVAYIGIARNDYDNANLIVAAPEMLAALRGMVAEFDKFSRYGSPIARDANEAMRHARAAIAKAEKAS